MFRERNIEIFVVVVLMLLLVSTYSYAADVKVILEDKLVELPINPELENGSTLVPMRAIFEEFGLDVDWQGKTKTVVAKKGDKLIKLIIGNKRAYVNGKPVDLEIPAKVIDGNTLVPVRFVAESLGIKTDWDDSSYSVLLNSNPPYGRYKVMEVVDENRIRVVRDGREEVVDFAGIEIPYKSREEVIRILKNKLEGKYVGIDFDENNKAYIFSKGEILNENLINKGHASMKSDYKDEFIKNKKELIEMKKNFIENKKNNKYNNKEELIKDKKEMIEKKKEMIQKKKNYYRYK